MTDISNRKIFSVIGSGHMGREIAQSALMSGIFEKVILHDIEDEALDKASKYIKNGLKKLESKGKLDSSYSVEDIFKNLVLEKNLQQAVKSADFIIEVIPEILELKQTLFKKLGEYAPEHAILSTNTSTMSITDIASTSGRPEKVVGMHFFTPVVVLRLIEVIKGEKTSDDTFEKCIAVGEKFPAMKGKKLIAKIDKESPGFIVNRLTLVSSRYLHYLLDIAYEKGLSAEAIDLDVGDMGGLGPCAKLDYLGLDIVINTISYLEKNISPELVSSKVIQKLVEEGHLGKKTGKGLYNWVEGKPILNKVEKANLFNPELYLAIQLNEGCRLLEEKIVPGYKIIDDAILAAMDMPGPFSPGKRNYEKWTKMLDDLVKESGIQYYKPCELMKTGGFLKMRK
ncbi:MAG: 3-hydroxyacyl-CoA dehydrogenase family protein [archaeon]|nr:3-hydroxyacyl-CoA dehydrogenase family protein [archaeon]